MKNQVREFTIMCASASTAIALSFDFFFFPFLFYFSFLIPIASSSPASDDASVGSLFLILQTLDSSAPFYLQPSFAICLEFFPSTDFFFLPSLSLFPSSSYISNIHRSMYMYTFSLTLTSISRRVLGVLSLYIPHFLTPPRKKSFYFIFVSVMRRNFFL